MTIKNHTSRRSQRLTVLCATLGGLSLAAPVLAQSNAPWLPIPGSGSISAGYVNQSGDSAYIGTLNLPITAITGGGAQRYKRETTSLKLSYGFVDSVSADATVAYAQTRIGAADNSSGIADSVVGVNWRVLDEFEQRKLPTVTLRFSAIINGNYDGARLAALGKDANGYGAAILVGRQFSALSVWGGLGFEKRENGVPNARYTDVNAAYAISKLTLSAPPSGRWGSGGTNHGSRLGLGRLPGDIRIESGHGVFFLPITTCVVVSVVISIVIWLVRRF